MQTFSPRISASECNELTNLRRRADKFGFALVNPEGGTTHIYLRPSSAQLTIR